MFSFLKHLWDTLDAEKQKQELQQKWDQEQRYLEAEIEKEENEKNAKGDTASAMQDILQTSNATSAEQQNGSDQQSNDERGKCFKRVGVITQKKSNHCIIDRDIFFDVSAAKGIADELRVGVRVEYLAYQKPNSDYIKVVKILELLDNHWDDEQPTECKIEEQIAELKNIQPKYFNTHQRNILGLIVERKRDAVLIDTDYKLMNVHLDSVEIDFVPKEGDRVYVCCNVQSDEHFVDRQGEILQEVSVHPARLLKQEKCTVRQVMEDWGVLNEDIYYSCDVLPNASKLRVGDVITADLIECERGNYIWRCIRFTILEEAYVPPERPLNDTKSPPASIVKQQNKAITVSEDQRCVAVDTFTNHTIEFTAVNNLERPVRCLGVDFIGRRRDSQLRLVQPDAETAFELAGGASTVFRFEAYPKFYGETRETFIIKFDTFRVKRSILLIVCENEADAAAALAAKDQPSMALPSNKRVNQNQRSRHYANQVWSKHNEVIPGVGLAVRRRFVAQRIAFYEVPERLRSAYLTSQNKQEMLDNIEGMFPTIKEELTMKNYVQRFQTLVHLEEIEYFVNFRNYDRERAHFQREGEFLALFIENLAERRPSLVIGDTVRAVNPWSDKDADNRSFDGVIHKVLFNRVLLKFNSGFQAKYNGEDYRLEFYFSRFAFRKQHFAINRIVKHLGEQFLFPGKIMLREQPQLDIELDDKDDLRLVDNGECKWFNASLNAIQKRAVRNILRGEVQNMPYVIFGPPGTGKTMTMVETMLQLVKLIPSARLLVGTPSNSSADLITTRLIESKALQPGDFVRLVSQNQIEKELVPEHLMPYCATVDIAADGTCNDSMIVTESGMKLRCQMKYLGRHRITISTCTTLGNFLQMGFPPGHFTHVLIDESGQCTEPEVMVAICQISQSRGQVILAGDPHQLQAIVVNRYASDRGLSLSYLERMLLRAPYTRDIVRFPDSCGFDPRLVTKLLYNYRSLPSILNVYNELFYDSELVAMVKDQNSPEAELLERVSELLPASNQRPKTHGVFFNGTRSVNKQESDSPSWYNPAEAKNLFLFTIRLYRLGISCDSIGIITPYMKQVKHIRNLFVQVNIAMPKIGSVEEFQGQERSIILISTVRSSANLIGVDLRHALGFVMSCKRMNVAVSRARCLMIVFGNPDLLYLDHSWRAYIKYCVDNDAYMGCDLQINQAEEAVNEEELQKGEKV